MPSIARRGAAVPACVCLLLTFVVPGTASADVPPAPAPAAADARIETPPSMQPAVSDAPIESVPQVSTAPARRYAKGSLSTIGAASVGVGLIRRSPAGSGFTALTLSGGVGVRWVSRLGLTLEPRLGVDGLLATGAAGLYAVFAARAGMGAGWTFALSDTTAISPMLAYEVVFVGGGISANLSGLQHTVAVEVPATFFFGPNVFVELILRGGVAGTPVGAVPIFALGYRIGLVWR